MTWIKICGTTNLEDARAAVEAGADAVGFVFAPSPRRISPKDAGKIIAELPQKIEKVGVFGNQRPEIIRETVKSAGLTAVQLHGDDNRELAEQLARRQHTGCRFRIIPVFAMRRLFDLATSGSELIEFADGIDTILLDSNAPGQRGGTGETWDWTLGRMLRRCFRPHMRMIVAGGLAPANVAEAIRTLQPWGVDVCSGVERTPGSKDHEKLKAFVGAVRGSEERSG